MPRRSREYDESEVGQENDEVADVASFVNLPSRLEALRRVRQGGVGEERGVMNDTPPREVKLIDLLITEQLEQWRTSEMVGGS